MYLTRKDLESLAHWLASELFQDYDSPMPAFTLMGEQGSALLDSALALPRQSAFGKDAYPSIFDKAAVLFRSLIGNHPLVDGNKRLATAAVLVFLTVNGWLLLAEREELVQKALKMASARGISWKSMSLWLRKRSHSWGDPRLETRFLSHFETELRRAVQEGELGEADLSQAVAFLDAISREAAGASQGVRAVSTFIRFSARFGAGIAEGKMPESVAFLFHNSLVSAVKDLSR